MSALVGACEQLTHKKQKYTREVEDVLLLLYYGHDSSRAPSRHCRIAEDAREYKRYNAW